MPPNPDIHSLQAPVGTPYLGAAPSLLSVVPTPEKGTATLSPQPASEKLW